MTGEVTVLNWQPTPKQRLAKARFWEAMETSWRDPASLSVQEMTKIVGAAKFTTWIHDPDFQAWFYNANIAKMKVQAAAEVAIERLLYIATQEPSKMCSAGAIVKASCELAKLAGMEPPKQVETKSKHEVIDSMDEEQMREFMQSNVQKYLLTMPEKERVKWLATTGVLPEAK